MGETGLGPGLILHALVDDLAIIQVALVEVGDPSTGDGGDMQVQDVMQVRQRKGKAFSLFGCNEFIDVDRVNRLLTFPVATTVAKGLPTSGETGKKDVRHHCHPLVRRMPASTCINQGQMQRRPPAAALPIMIAGRSLQEQTVLTATRNARVLCSWWTLFKSGRAACCTSAAGSALVSVACTLLSTSDSLAPLSPWSYEPRRCMTASPLLISHAPGGSTWISLTLPSSMIMA
jgi:hypothetical protein